MNLNPAALLALIGDLYVQITRLTQENAELRQRLEGSKPPDPSSVAPPENAA